MTFASLPDGSFDEVYSAGTDVYVQKYTSDAVASGNAFIVATNGSDTSNRFLEPGVKAAADKNGNLLIVYAVGTVQGQQDLDAVAVSGNGTIARGPWLVTSSADADSMPTVALDPSGAGIVAWVDTTEGAILACRVSDYGLTQGLGFKVYSDPTFAPPRFRQRSMMLATSPWPTPEWAGFTPPGSAAMAPLTAATTWSPRK